MAAILGNDFFIAGNIDADPKVELDKAQEQQMEEIIVSDLFIKNTVEATNDTFTEVTQYEPPTEYEDELPDSPDVNSESFIVPEYNPAMEAYLKKLKPKPAPSTNKKKKPKKRSFFRRVREKVTMYLRKLTLSDIRFMDDED